MHWKHTQTHCTWWCDDERYYLNNFTTAWSRRDKHGIAVILMMMMFWRELPVMLFSLFASHPNVSFFPQLSIVKGQTYWRIHTDNCWGNNLSVSNSINVKERHQSSSHQCHGAMDFRGVRNFPQSCCSGQADSLNYCQRIMLPGLVVRWTAIKRLIILDLGRLGDQRCLIGSN